MTTIFPRLALLLAVTACSFCAAPASGQSYSLARHDGGVKIMHGDALVADYLTLSKSKPILWPINGPDGVAMTRQYPMVPDSKNEKHDHPHHRSFWFTHGIVNGHDFWLEGGDGGITEHQKFTILESNDESATVAARNVWKTAGGEPVLTEHRTYKFSHAEEAVVVDCEFVVTASHGKVNFGDTKEGTFGIRIASSMKTDAKQGGLITNSHGDHDKDAWGKRAEWVDYTGPIHGKEIGIAILCHPSTYNFPNRWHVRTYGLFAANPFGVHHFEGQKEATAGVDLPAGESLTFRYRVLFHTGDTDAAKVAEHFAEYSQLKF